DVFVKLETRQSLILESYATQIEVPDFPYQETGGSAVALTGEWKITFDSGGPELPPAYETNSPRYWTDSGEESYNNFSGTATYALSFDKPAGENRRWLLKLEAVKESAEVILNGKLIATLIGPVYQAEFESALLKERNLLQIKVSNLMANRIAYMDRNNILWKKFYNVNFPSRLRENSKDNVFTAAHWKPRPSGLNGKVELYPLR
ncbi:MAG: glycosylhydrolase-like jelly roll fold domain-containing protein, partial [Cyclobacteriaceae bacterium]